MSAIYCITNNIDGKRYFGYATDPERRKQEHFRDKSIEQRTIRKLHGAMGKYGKENFSFEVVYESDDNKFVGEVMEPFFIALYETQSKGYNLASGGKITYSFSDETKLLMGRSQKDRWASKTQEQRAEHSANVSAAQKKRWATITPDQRKKIGRKIGDAQLGRVLSEDRRMRIGEASQLMWDNKSQEERNAFAEQASKNAKRRFDSMTDEELKAYGKKSNEAKMKNKASLTPKQLEERRQNYSNAKNKLSPAAYANMQKKSSSAVKSVWANYTPEQREVRIANMRKAQLDRRAKERARSTSE
jgi:group I intron endonuclease